MPFQFCEYANRADFEDVRRVAMLEEKEDIRPNDFLFAMLVRLGKIKVSDSEVCKARQLFLLLDKDHTGVLNDDDIEGSCRA